MTADTTESTYQERSRAVEIDARRNAAKQAELIARYGMSDPDAIDDADPIMLIERSSIDRSYYLTSWQTLAEAAAYHDGQEYPEDWPIVEAIDLATGKRYYAVPATSFDEFPA